MRRVYKFDCGRSSRFARTSACALRFGLNFASDSTSCPYYKYWHCTSLSQHSAVIDRYSFSNPVALSFCSCVRFMLAGGIGPHSATGCMDSLCFCAFLTCLAAPRSWIWSHGSAYGYEYVSIRWLDDPTCALARCSRPWPFSTYCTAKPKHGGAPVRF